MQLPYVLGEVGGEIRRGRRRWIHAAEMREVGHIGVEVGATDLEPGFGG